MKLDKFDNHYNAAADAKMAGDIVTAKRQYILASLELFSLALVADDELKAIMVERAEEIVVYADSLHVEKNLLSGDNDETVRDVDMKFKSSNSTGVTFKDVAGLQSVKDVIYREVIDPREHAEIYERFKIETGTGVLMYGPPGVGKTMIAQAIANEAGAKFFSIKCSDLLGSLYGEAEKNIADLFNQVRKEKVAIIFFDEFDSIAPKRNIDSSMVMSRVVNELLSQIDGFQKSDTELLLLASTNCPDDIDSAVMRSGRFSVIIGIPLPDKEARKHILEKKLKGLPIDDDIDFDDLAMRTEGFNGADVTEFCNRSKDFARKRSIEAKKKGKGIEDIIITKNDVYGTLRSFSSSVREEDIRKFEEFEARQGVAK